MVEGDITMNYPLFKKVDIIKLIKLIRMRWATQLLRIDSSRTTLRGFYAITYYKRPSGSPKNDDE